MLHCAIFIHIYHQDDCVHPHCPPPKSSSPKQPTFSVFLVTDIYTTGWLKVFRVQLAAIAITQDRFVSHLNPSSLWDRSQQRPSITPRHFWESVYEGREGADPMDISHSALTQTVLSWLMPCLSSWVHFKERFPWDPQASGLTTSLCVHSSLERALTPIHGLGKGVSERGDDTPWRLGWPWLLAWSAENHLEGEESTQVSVSVRVLETASVVRARSALNMVVPSHSLGGQKK